MPDSKDVLDSSEDNKTVKPLRVARNLVVVNFMPWLLILLYLSYPRIYFPGINNGLLILVVSLTISLVYLKGWVARSIAISVILVAMIFSGSNEVSRYLIFNTAIVLCILQYISNRSLRAFLIAVVYVAVPIVLAAWFFNFFIYDSTVDPPGLSFFGSKVGFVNILMLGLFAAAYLILVEDRRQLMRDDRMPLMPVLYLLCLLLLVSLFSTLSKQVYPALAVFLLMIVPRLFLDRRPKMAINCVLFVAVAFLIFACLDFDTLVARIDSVGLNSSFDLSATREALELSGDIENVEVDDVDFYISGITECHKADNYSGCVSYSVICREDYLRGYFRFGKNANEIRDNFYNSHRKLASYLGNEEARSKWITACSRKLVYLDTSDRAILLVKGIEQLKNFRFFGSDADANIKFLNWYSEELEQYSYYHNFIFDLAADFGILILGVFLVLILFSLHISLRGNLEHILLGGMVLAFLVLRLFSGSHYELFYLILSMGLLFQMEFTGKESC